jgi:signal transduction histidine kinase
MRHEDPDRATRMMRRLARIAAVGALAFGVLAVIIGVTAAVTVRDRAAPGTVVVVGNPASPGMQDVIAEVRQAAATGDPLRSSLTLNVGFLLISAIALLWIGVGALIVWRQPGNWAGWLFLIIGSTFPLGLIAQAVVIADLNGGASFPFTGFFAWVGEFALEPLALVPLLVLLYPNGRPPGVRWRWSIGGLVGGAFVAFLGFLLRPGPYNNWRDDGIVFENPLGIHGFGWAGAVIAVGTVVAVAAAVSTAVAVVLRFRRSSGEERQQMRLVAFIAGLAATGIGVLILVTVVVGVFGFNDGGTDPIFPILFGFSALMIFVGLPISYLVAILRYRLWALDIVVKKAVVALVITLLLTAMALFFIGTVGQVAVWEGTNRDVGVLLGVLAGTLIWPIARFARRIARRVAFGKRASTYEVLTAFSERVGETYSTADVLPRMVRVLASGTGARSARVLLHVGPQMREVARWPEDDDPVTDEHVEPVVDRGEELGAPAVSMPANDPMNPAKERLVKDLASQAGLVLRNVKLIEDLRASRTRLVAAQDEERRKIERNIHDGAQQQLVALAVKQRLAASMVGKDDDAARQMLDELQTQTNDALDDLRDLARGIYPPLLADKGLVAALEAQARKAPVPVSVHADGLGRYPQEVESAIYFSCLEALQNVGKYASAAEARIDLADGDGSVRFDVTDDGVGFDPTTKGHGSGLQGIADRLASLGGTLEIRSAPRNGTTVTGKLPSNAVVRVVPGL